MTLLVNPCPQASLCNCTNSVNNNYPKATRHDNKVFTCFNDYTSTNLTLSKAVCWLSSCVCGKAFIAVTVVSIFIRVFAGEKNSLENTFTLVWHKTFGTLKIWAFMQKILQRQMQKPKTCMIGKLIGWHQEKVDLGESCWQYRGRSTEVEDMGSSQDKTLQKTFTFRNNLTTASGQRTSSEL